MTYGPREFLVWLGVDRNACGSTHRYARGREQQPTRMLHSNAQVSMAWNRPFLTAAFVGNRRSRLRVSRSLAPTTASTGERSSRDARSDAPSTRFRSSDPVAGSADVVTVALVCSCLDE